MNDMIKIRFRRTLDIDVIKHMVYADSFAHKGKHYTIKLEKSVIREVEDDDGEMQKVEVMEPVTENDFEYYADSNRLTNESIFILNMVSDDEVIDLSVKLNNDDFKVKFVNDTYGEVTDIDILVRVTKLFDLYYETIETSGGLSLETLNDILDDYVD